jgi:hypothetical protein
VLRVPVLGVPELGVPVFRVPGFALSPGSAVSSCSADRLVRSGAGGRVCLAPLT